MKKIIVLFLLVLCLLLSSCDRADLITFQWEDFLLDCLGSDWCPDNFVGSRWECQEIDFWFEVIEDTVDVTADDAEPLLRGVCEGNNVTVSFNMSKLMFVYEEIAEDEYLWCMTFDCKYTEEQLVAVLDPVRTRNLLFEAETDVLTFNRVI